MVQIALSAADAGMLIDRLAARIQEEFRLDPFDKATLFLFSGRRADRIKGLLWEGDGFLLLYKRLEDGRYKWPGSASEVLAMSPQQYRWLMEGLDIRQKRYVKDVRPKKANSLKPYEYLKHLLTVIPQHMDDPDLTFLDDLLPWSDALPDEYRN